MRCNAPRVTRSRLVVGGDVPHPELLVPASGGDGGLPRAALGRRPEAAAAAVLLVLPRPPLPPPGLVVLVVVGGGGGVGLLIRRDEQHDGAEGDVVDALEPLLAVDDDVPMGPFVFTVGGEEAAAAAAGSSAAGDAGDDEPARGSRRGKKHVTSAVHAESPLRDGRYASRVKRPESPPSVI